jgi:hypothetical protein
MLQKVTRTTVHYYYSIYLELVAIHLEKMLEV